jgi:hypothetical protein
MKNRLPERSFFFGILSATRHQYLLDIIKEAHSQRYTAKDDEEKKHGILITDEWMKKLQESPYHSSNYLC